MSEFVKSLLIPWDKNAEYAERLFGTVPWFADAWRLPAEDALDIRESKGDGLHIVCLCFSRMANFDDMDPLAQEPGVRLTMLRTGQAIPGDADLVILPGSKSTRGDLDVLRAQGWDTDLRAHHRRGGHILGLCGGYQMLGARISDPDGIEGAPGDTPGLGFLNVNTTMTPDKRLTEISARHAATDIAFRGYEIHIGRTNGPDCARPFAFVGAAPEGAESADGTVRGSYLHGMFRDDAFRHAFLATLGGTASTLGYNATVETTLDALAQHLETHLDIGALLAVAL